MDGAERRSSSKGCHERLDRKPATSEAAQPEGSVQARCSVLNGSSLSRLEALLRRGERGAGEAGRAGVGEEGPQG